MIKRLRWKLVGITTVLLTVVLGMILSFVYYATQSGFQRDSLDTLEQMTIQVGKPGRPGKFKTFPDGRCFLLQQERDGTLVAIGPEHYLEDREVLLEILAEAEGTGERSGVLKERGLRFLRREDGPTTGYAFMDISAEEQALSVLVTTCIVIFVVGVVCFFGISILLARWATRPVEQAWDQQRQFVADASHELKTPLTVIMTNAELMTGETVDPAQQARSADSILTMSRRMRSLVEELLDQARVDNGTVRAKWETVDLSKLVSDSVLPFEPLYFEAGRMLDSQIQPGITVTGSAQHLRQVVDILLDNGCKYSTPGGTVLLRLERYHRGCLIGVTSPGEALTEQQCEDIFKRFYRVDTARKIDGSCGLGLSIAKGIVEQHKGKIWAQSQEGQNTFFVQLPG